MVAARLIYSRGKKKEKEKDEGQGGQRSSLEVKLEIRRGQIIKIRSQPLFWVQRKWHDRSTEEMTWRAHGRAAWSDWCFKWMASVVRETWTGRKNRSWERSVKGCCCNCLGDMVENAIEMERIDLSIILMNCNHVVSFWGQSSCFTFQFRAWTSALNCSS